MRPTNPRWRTAAILKIEKSWYLQNHLTDFEEIFHDDVHLSSGPQWLLKNSHVKNPNFKNPRWRMDAILKRLTRYLGNRLTDFDEIWHGDAHWASQPKWLLKILNMKMQHGGRPPSWKSKNCDISKSAWPKFTKFCMMSYIWLLDFNGGLKNRNKAVVEISLGVCQWRNFENRSTSVFENTYFTFFFRFQKNVTFYVFWQWRIKKS